MCRKQRKEQCIIVPKNVDECILKITVGISGEVFPAKRNHSPRKKSVL